MRQNVKTVSPMSNEGRNAYVVEHLTAALLERLREKPLEDVSVSELCEKAGVGRASFYRNFGGKEDILRSYIGHIFHEWTDRHDGGEQPVRDQIRTLFAHFEAHRDFYVLLNGRGLVPLLKDAVIGVFDLKAEDPAAVAYAKAFVAYSFYGWIETWFRRGMRESAEELAALFPAGSEGEG